MRHPILLNLILILPLPGIGQDNFTKKASAGLTISCPWINNYSFYDYDLKKSSSKSGFTGLGASIFYKTGKNKISLNFGFTGDLPAPVGAFDYGHEGTRTNIGSIIMEVLYHQKVYHKLNIIAGLNAVNYRFNFTSYVDSIPSYIKRNKTIGLTIGTEYLFSRNFALSLFYRPALVMPGTKQYRHVISLDARFDINIWRRK
jgi:hypothetical protein